MGATLTLHDDIAVITINNPPVNGFSLVTRRELGQALEEAAENKQIAAIVLVGAGNVFSGGADIREFGSQQAWAEPNLRSLTRQLEFLAKPVVAAIHGLCLGGGLEFAMGAHFRVAAPGTRFALPEVKLGLVPGGGGTQRLPRALGVEAALNMIVSGEQVDVAILQALPGQRLIDRIITGDLMEGAIAFARERAVDIGQNGTPLPRLRDLPAQHPLAEGFLQFARNTARAASDRFPAPVKCIDVVETGIRHGFEAGLASERDTFVALMESPESRALRHAFFAERAASRIPEVPESTPLRNIGQVAVIGAGTMGTGITMNFLNVGIPVTLVEAKPEALERGVNGIRSIYAGQVKKGKLKAPELEQRLALLQATMRMDDCAGADLVIEAVFEDRAVKESVFRELDRLAKPGAILATNTSTLDVDAIAAVTSRPADVLGMHFFSPANVMKLLEVVRGKATAHDVLATVMSIAKKIRKTAVVSRVCDGFIGNRMIDQYGRQSGFLLEEGCTPQQVDRALESYGFAMGIFRMGDLAGNDIGWAVRKRRYVEKPDVRYSRLYDMVCELGRYGQKTSAGWYDYQPGKRDAAPSPVIATMIEKFRADTGRKPRDINDEEIVHRLVWALVNEGARILEEGIASRASDIDLVYLAGYGFPAHRGGPMRYADEIGLYNVVQDMKRFSRNPNDDATFWEPAPLLARLAAEGGRFT